ncbi:DUF3732 domain-containing protein [Leucobacter chromiireducens]|uniref:Nuclease SbcCD subunit C n=1 Tax=Leucobacter chromiireducens subsp. solipictus TaxID=398235 RepID=A0ABS1SEC5_9MICO|nr:DUF3732 domain-containing protein [Leucobacter chromiireducens]MBL3678904.1 DUF3732 domain-containing protein [Leucobacter chromiireducens subsp. solipictus]
MQIVSISIYHQDGRRRDVNFRLNALNIITGDSKTGKSSLLNIVDYCLGRKKSSIPRTKWFKAIAWFAVVFQLPGGNRALVARIPHAPGISNHRAMLEFGNSEMVAPPAEQLRLNVDTEALRTQLGTHIGLAGVQLESSENSTRGPVSVGLGSAVPFTLQEQHEIDNKVSLFHRQDEHGIAQGLRDSLPFFLGAVDGEQAAKRARLREARQKLRRAENALDAAEEGLKAQHQELRELLSEARSVGLITSRVDDPGQSIVDVLNNVRFTRLSEPVISKADLAAQDERRRNEQKRFELAQELNVYMNNRELLLDVRDGEGDYDDSLSLQIERLSVLDFIPHRDRHKDVCPVCEQVMPQPDATVESLNSRLYELRDELSQVTARRPKRQQALRENDGEIDRIRRELSIIDATMDGSAVSDLNMNPSALREAQQFVRGRIDAILSNLQGRDDTEVARLRSAREQAQAMVEALESELDGGEAREQLTSRLNALSVLLGSYSQRLNLEQADMPIRLDVHQLTIVVDTEDGPLPLPNIGSGENWVGYHVAAHLALHEYFLKQRRPVPRFLMFDQPSKAHFQSDRPRDPNDEYVDPDRESVRNMFKLFADYSDALNGQIQLIVVDHADYEDDWFANSVIYNWRQGRTFIPNTWLSPEAQLLPDDASSEQLRLEATP